MKDVIEIPALTYLDNKYGQDKVDQILDALKNAFGISEVDYLMTVRDAEEIECIIEDVI